MDAFGMDVIIVETVGVGQSEVDIVKTADTTMVVVIPGMGDDIQAIKAGILEIGDLITINKADREGTDKLNIEMEMMLELNPEHVQWRPPINRTIASRGEGIEEVVNSIEEHHKYLVDSGKLADIRKKRIKSEVTDMINVRVNRYIDKNVVRTPDFEKTVVKLQTRELEPYSVVDDIVGKVLK
jgi:LAO/AO transport system kinase